MIGVVHKKYNKLLYDEVVGIIIIAYTRNDVFFGNY